MYYSGCGFVKEKISPRFKTGSDAGNPFSREFTRMGANGKPRAQKLPTTARLRRNETNEKEEIKIKRHPELRQFRMGLET
jgi:hypothetical protein